MFKAILWVFTTLAFLSVTSCQSFSYGPPRSNCPSTLSVNHANRADMDMMDDAEDDKIGVWLIAGIAGAIAIGSAVLVPLYLNDKL